MAFEDLRERFSSEFKNQWEQFQESSLYILVKEKYENLTPPMQKLALAGVGLFISYLLLSLPLSYYWTSQDYITEFENKRQLIRDLLKVSREASEAPDLPVPPEVNALKSQVDNQIQNARLLPEQIKGTEVSSERVGLIPENLLQGVLKVSLAHLNLRQIVDLGYQFQSISPSVKMTDLQMQANQKNPKYFDVVYKLAILAVPSQVEEQPEPEKAPPKKRGR